MHSVWNDSPSEIADGHPIITNKLLINIHSHQGCLLGTLVQARRVQMYMAVSRTNHVNTLVPQLPAWETIHPGGLSAVWILISLLVHRLRLRQYHNKTSRYHSPVGFLQGSDKMISTPEKITTRRDGVSERPASSRWRRSIHYLNTIIVS